jgi:hypothetical protein
MGARICLGGGFEDYAVADGLFMLCFASILLLVENIEPDTAQHLVSPSVFFNCGITDRGWWSPRRGERRVVVIFRVLPRLLLTPLEEAEGSIGRDA